MDRQKTEQLGRLERARREVADIRPAATPEQIEEAREMYQNSECEIDDDAVLSVAEDGTGHWVSAWVWVPTEDE